ncbi:MAG: hypothetical protein KDN19_21360 [Verrucomicrobiae bacterium]|nr:hypothetical protein [Verrucomicrobiae bacterium]
MKIASKFLAVFGVLGFLFLSKTSRAEDPKPADEPASEPADILPSIEEVTVAVKQTGAAFRRDASLFGGYPRGWTTDQKNAISEGSQSPTLIEIQPPGTPAIGLAWVEAWKVTHDPLYLQAAREVAQALIWTQLSSGGWPSEFDFHPESSAKYHTRRDVLAGDTEMGKRSARSTLDDNKTQSALLFLLELAYLEPSKGDAVLREALDFGLDSLLAAQAPNGGWPQMYSGPADPSLPADLKATYDENWSRTFPHVDYTPWYTLNDGNIYLVTRLMERAYELTGDERFVESMKRTGEFLIAAQLPEPHPAWAQQYDHAMKPAWARKFEPPGVSSLESRWALETLREVWLVTGDEKWLVPFDSAMKWLRSVRLDDGRWSRLYELGTNKPLYLMAETYEVTYDDSNLPTHYGFKLDADFGEGLDKLEDEIAAGREEVLRRRRPMTQEKSWAKSARAKRRDVRQALKEIDKRGHWLNEEGELDSRLFLKRFNALVHYLEGAKNGGAVFEELWKASQPPPAPPQPEVPGQDAAEKPEKSVEKS